TRSPAPPQQLTPNRLCSYCTNGNIYAALSLFCSALFWRVLQALWHGYSGWVIAAFHLHSTLSASHHSIFSVARLPLYRSRTAHIAGARFFAATGIYGGLCVACYKLAKLAWCYGQCGDSGSRHSRLACAKPKGCSLTLAAPLPPFAYLAMYCLCWPFGLAGC